MAGSKRIFRRPRTRTIRLEGELNWATRSELLSFVHEELNPPGDLTLDLSNVHHIDSAGLRALIELTQELAPESHLLLLGPPEPVRRSLQGAGLGRLVL